MQKVLLQVFVSLILLFCYPVLCHAPVHHSDWWVACAQMGKHPPHYIKSFGKGDAPVLVTFDPGQPPPLPCERPAALVTCRRRHPHEHAYTWQLAERRQLLPFQSLEGWRLQEEGRGDFCWPVSHTWVKRKLKTHIDLSWNELILRRARLLTRGLDCFLFICLS